MCTYTIRRGDTLARIAAAHRVTLEALIGANPRYRERRPDQIRLGDVIVIPGANSPGCGSEGALRPEEGVGRLAGEGFPAGAEVRASGRRPGEPQAP